MLFCHPTQDDVATVKEILSLFGEASGLRVNFAKNSATLLHGDPEVIAPMIAQLGCPVVELPITYLGIPLTARHPTAAQLQPLVDGAAGRLPAWKTWLMNKTGRLALVKSVLSAIPVHQLLAFAPQRKPSSSSRRFSEGFSGLDAPSPTEGIVTCTGAMSDALSRMVAWGYRIWNTLGLHFGYAGFGSLAQMQGRQGLDLQFSAEERALFFASTTMSVGNGATALFWEDRWLNGRSVSEIMPLLHQCIHKRRCKIKNGGRRAPRQYLGARHTRGPWHT